MKIKNKNEYPKKNIARALLLLAVFSIFYYAKAENSITDISQGNNGTSEETQSKIDELNKRAEIYRQIIDIKKKQGESLNNQLSIMDSNIQKVQSEIEASKQQINELNGQITRIDRQIKEKEELIESQKKLLSELIQSYYQVSQTNLATIYLTEGNIASFMVTKDRIGQTGDKIKDLVKSVKEIKNGLETQSSELDQKKKEIVTAHEQLQDRSSDLQSTKQQREDLLEQTKGEEARYAQLLQRVEQQKQDLLNIDQLFLSGNFSVGGLSASEYIKKNEPPSSLLASTNWFYSQKDPRWANTNIGNSTSDMKNWGCAVTSVAMVAKFHGDSITPGALAKKPIFSFDLINWQMNQWSGAKITLASQYGSSHRNLNWSAIDASIKDKQPVIVYIGKTGGKGGHYVVIHTKDSKTGKYVVHDPYFGPNLYLDTSRALVGAMGTDTATYMDQMIIYN